jgi:hypothetical protein
MHQQVVRQVRLQQQVLALVAQPALELKQPVRLQEQQLPELQLAQQGELQQVQQVQKLLQRQSLPDALRLEQLNQQAHRSK